MAKIRVYELAKELNTTSKRLMEKLEEINISLKNHMSLLEDDQLEALYRHVGIKKKTDEPVKDQEPSKEQESAKGHEAETPKTATKTEQKKDIKSAPRIIRKTEIIIDSREEKNQSGYGTYDSRQGNRNDNNYNVIRSSEGSSGLRPGFIRDTRSIIQPPRDYKQESRQESRNFAAENKNVPVRADVKTPEKEETRMPPKMDTAPAENKPVESKVSAPQERKSADTVTSAPAKPETGTDNRQLTGNRDGENKSYSGNRDGSNRQFSGNRGENDRTFSGNREGGNRPFSGSRDGENSRPSGAIREGVDRSGQQHQGTHGGGNFNRHQGERPKNNFPNRDFKPNTAAGSRSFTPPIEYEKPFEKPQARKEEKFQRVKEQSRDDSRKEVKKDMLKPFTGAKGEKYNKFKIAGGQNKVSEILSEDFVLQEFYNESDARKLRRTPKNKKMGEEQHVPQRAVMTDVSLPEFQTVKELAEALKKTSADIIKKLISYGVMATINQIVDFDTASMIAEEYGIKAHKIVEVNEEDILFDDTDDDKENLVPRPPVVVVMGHVDHGKTSLLDAIRKTNVISQEAGGITQHIGAYTVKIKNRQITFLDTPGHEAFTAMRARGAQVTDIAILVVAADDGVMPQTVEAINHAKAANVSIVVAINKIDKPGANVEKIKQDLTEYGLVSEEWGGDTIFVPVSAKQMTNIDTLLEMVVLVADVLELKANPNKQAKGTIIEALLDKNKGPIATVLVQRGTLRVGDSIVTGTTFGRIRAMVDDKGSKVNSAGPSVPVEILGLPEVPEAGEIFYAVTDEKIAKQLAEKRRLKQREEHLKASSKLSLENLFDQINSGKVKDLNIIVKADVQGSVEAVKQSLEKLSNEEVRVKIIHGAVGAITESDIKLAEVSNAIVIGFNVRPAANVAEIAQSAGVDIKLYRIIYNAIEDIQAAMTGMLEPKFKEAVLGHAEVRQVFKVPGVGAVGGCHVIDGKILRTSEVRVVRDGIVIHEGKIASLKRFKDDVKEVQEGYDCGIGIERFNDIKDGDVIEAFEMQKVVD